MTNERALEEVKRTIETVKLHLVKLRAKFDQFDSNHPAQQLEISQQITIAAARLDTLVKLAKLLGGE